MNVFTYTRFLCTPEKPLQLLHVVRRICPLFRRSIVYPTMFGKGIGISELNKVCERTMFFSISRIWHKTVKTFINPYYVSNSNLVAPVGHICLIYKKRNTSDLSTLKVSRKYSKYLVWGYQLKHTGLYTFQTILNIFCCSPILAIS